MFRTTRRGTHRAEGPAVIDYRGLVSPITKGATGVAAATAVAATGVVGLQVTSAEAATVPLPKVPAPTTRLAAATTPTTTLANQLGTAKIRPGHRGPQVSALQTILNNKGASLVVDGSYGPATRAALYAFQRESGILVDGIVGPNTRAKLLAGDSAPSPRTSTTNIDINVRVYYRNRGPLVERMQSMLRDHGASIAVDGSYGPATRRALLSFQANAGLAVDGIVGPNTWTALMGGSDAKVTTSAPAQAPASSNASDSSIVAMAERQLGKRYVWGSSDPNVGFDCSGLVKYVYNSHGITVPRVAKQQAFAGRKISRAEARPGDLVVFTADDYGHIGIYAGGNTIIDASGSQQRVVKRQIWTSNMFFVTYR